MTTKTAVRAHRNLISVFISMVLAVSLIGSTSAANAAELDTPEVTVYITCNASTHLMGIKATIIGVAAHDTLPVTYNIDGGTEHSLGNVYTNDYGIGSSNTANVNSPYPAVWVYVTIGGTEGRAMSKTCP